MAFPPKKKAAPFEMSRKDKEHRGMREGSRREEMVDKHQARGKKSGGRKGCS